jgi:hypothetical protein
VGARFSTPVQIGSRAHTASCTMGTGAFPGVKRPGCGADYSHHLVPRLKKEYSYTSISLVGLRGLFCGAIYLFNFITEYIIQNMSNSFNVPCIHWDESQIIITVCL